MLYYALVDFSAKKVGTNADSSRLLVSMSIVCQAILRIYIYFLVTFCIRMSIEQLLHRITANFTYFYEIDLTKHRILLNFVHKFYYTVGFIFFLITLDLHAIKALPFDLHYSSVFVLVVFRSPVFDVLHLLNFFSVSSFTYFSLKVKRNSQITPLGVHFFSNDPSQLLLTKFGWWELFRLFVWILLAVFLWFLLDTRNRVCTFPGKSFMWVFPSWLAHGNCKTIMLKKGIQVHQKRGRGSIIDKRAFLHCTILTI